MSTPPMTSTFPRIEFATSGSSPSDVTVNLDRLIESRMLLVANSGGGKSRAIRQLLEETHGRVLQIVFDVEGEFTTLRDVADVIVAGEGGDVPAHPDIARTLCRRLLTIGASAVLNLYELKLQDRRRFVRLFLDELMALPRELWRPALIVLDEAHQLCPERGSGEAESTDAVITLCTQGRKRGFAAVLATQRISKLHKDAAAELLNKLIGRTSLDVDVKRAAAELGLDRQQWAALKALKPGEFYAYGPAIRDDVVQVRTGAVRTKPPKLAETSAPVVRASVATLLTQLGDLPALAKRDAQTIEELQAKVVDLAKALRQANARQLVTTIDASQAAVDAARQAGITEGLAQGRTHANALWDRAVRELADRMTAEQPAAAPVPLQDRRRGAAVESPPTFKVTTSNAPATTRQLTVAMKFPDTPRGGLTGVQQKIVDTIAGLSDLGIESPDKATVAALCDYHPNAKSYANAMGALRTSGYVAYPAPGSLALTDAGRALATAQLQVDTVRDLHAMWFRKLGNVAERILAPLLAAYPKALPAADVAASAGYHPNAKSFANTKGRLRTLGLISYPRTGEIAATPLLFPQGLPK